MSRTLKIIVLILIILATLFGFLIYKINNKNIGITEVGIVVEKADDYWEGQNLIETCEFFAQENNFTCNVYETGVAPTEEQITNSVEDAAQNDIVISTNYKFTKTMETSAAAHPNSYFIVLGDDSQPLELENMVYVNFKEEEAGYIAGVVAAQTAIELNSDKVGFIGGEDIPVTSRYYYGFLEGVAAVDENIEVVTRYIDTFYDTDAAYSAALGLYNQDIKVIFGAAGMANYGINQAAEDQKLANNQVYMIGSGANQCEYFDEPETCLTSVGKNFNEFFYTFLTSIETEQFGSTYGGKQVDYGFVESWFSIEQTKVLSDMTNVNNMMNETLTKLKNGEIKLDSSGIITKEDAVNKTK